MQRRDCTRCPLHKTARNVGCDGRGAEPPNVDILFIGEAPGRQEDITGKIWCGDAGQLAEALIAEAGIPPHRIHLENLVRCVPWESSAPDSDVRPPDKREIEQCFPYLVEEVYRLNPKVIVTAGNTPTRWFTGRDKITSIRGMRFDVPITMHGSTRTFPVIPVIHPASVIRGRMDHRNKIVSDLAVAWKLAQTGATREPEIVDYGVINTLPELEDYCQELLALYEDGFIKSVSLDVETAPADPENNPEAALDPYDLGTRLISVQLSYKPRQGRLILVQHKDSAVLNERDYPTLLGWLKKVAETIPIDGTNVQFDYQMLLMKCGIEMKEIAFDAILAHSCLRGELKDLEYLAAKYTGMAGWKSEIANAKLLLPPAMQTMEYAPLDVLQRYGCADSDAVCRIKPVLLKVLAEKKLTQVYKERYLGPYIPFTWLRIDGAHADRERNDALKTECEADLEKYRQEVTSFKRCLVWQEVNKKPNPKRTKIKIYWKVECKGCGKLCFRASTNENPIGTCPRCKVKNTYTEEGRKTIVDDTQPEFLLPEFNPGSAYDVHDLLYVVMEIPKPVNIRHQQRTETMTGKKILKGLWVACTNKKRTEDAALIQAILNYKRVKQMLTHFLRKLPLFLRSYVRTPDAPFWLKYGYDFGKELVHPEWDHTGTITGRPSCSKPNMQNLPK